MEAYEGVEIIQLHAFSTSRTKWSCVAIVMPWSLYHNGKSPSTYWIGGWEGAWLFWMVCRRDKFLIPIMNQTSKFSWLFTICTYCISNSLH